MLYGTYHIIGSFAYMHYGPALATGSLCESFTHLRYKWVKKIGRTRASAARGCANTAPAAMPPPTEAREGCSGLVGEACARQLDGVWNLGFPPQVNFS